MDLMEVKRKKKTPAEAGGFLAGKGNAVFLGDGANLLNGQFVLLE